MFECMSSSMDYFMARKNFTKQYAAFTLISYMMSIGGRNPHRLTIFREYGSVWSTEAIPCKIMLISIES